MRATDPQARSPAPPIGSLQARSRTLDTLHIVDHQALGDRVYEILREKLVRREFTAIERLSSRQIAASLGVSVAPVKTALARLSGEGLVTVLPRRGTVVTSLSREEVADLFETRLGLEVLATELAISRAEADDLVDLRSLHESLCRLADERPVTPELLTRIVTLDFQFHIRLVQAAKSRHLLSAYSDLNILCQMVSYTLLSNDAGYLGIVPNHEAILGGLERRDASGTVTALRAHLQSALTSKLRAIAELEGLGVSTPLNQR